MSFITARPQCERSRKSILVWSALIEDLIGTPLIDFCPVKSRSRSLERPPPPSLITWLMVMPRFSQACSCSALVPGNVRLGLNKVRKALGINQVGKLIAYTSVEQEHAWEHLGITNRPVHTQGGGGRATHL